MNILKTVNRWRYKQGFGSFENSANTVLIAIVYANDYGEHTEESFGFFCIQFDDTIAMLTF